MRSGGTGTNTVQILMGLLFHTVVGRVSSAPVASCESDMVAADADADAEAVVVVRIRYCSFHQVSIVGIPAWGFWVQVGTVGWAVGAAGVRGALAASPSLSSGRDP